MIKNKNVISIITYLSLCAANCSGKAAPSSSKISSEKRTLDKNDLNNTTANVSLKHNVQRNRKQRDKSLLELENNGLNDKFREQSLESPVAPDDEKNSSFYASELFLKNLRKINKYKKIVPIKQCDHDEKNHTDEELELMKHFSKAMLDATNKFRTNPEYFLNKIEEERNYIIKNFNNSAKTSYFVEKKFINGINTICSANIREANAAAYNDAIKYLKNYIAQGRKLPALKSLDVLVKSSLLHAKAMSKHDFFDHDGVCSSKAEKNKSFLNPFERIFNYYQPTGNFRCTENLSHNSIDAKKLTSIDDIAEHIVMGLFVDDGVPSRGHRENLMDANVTHLGSAIYEHPGKLSTDLSVVSYVTVMNFSKG